MSRSFYRNRASLGSIPQLSSVAYIPPPPTIGFQWNQGNDTVARLDDAVGLVANAVNASGNGVMSPVNDFNSLSPWKDMRRCNLSAGGVVNAYYGDVGYKDDGTNGQVMVEIPKFYYKYEKDGSTYKWWISPKAQAGYSVHPAFVRNSVEVDKIYVGAYEADSNYGSRSGQSPKVNTSITNFRSGFQGLGYNSSTYRGWNQYDVLTMSAINLLYVVEYAHFDSQTKIGKGVVDLSAKINTGGTSSLGNYSGMASGTNGKVSISYRGVENLWGNVWQWVDGINISSSNAYVSDHNYASDVTSGRYVNVGKLATSDGTGSNILDIGYGFFPSATSGSSNNSHLYDYEYTSSSSNQVLHVGGRWANGLNAGAFTWAWTTDSSYSASHIGGRASYI